MNIHQIITEIGKADAEVFERMDTRRESLRNFGKTGAKIALTALPLALGGFLKKAYAGKPEGVKSVIEILNYALTLEHLEYAFYKTSYATPGLIPAGPAVLAIKTIRDHENAHVDLLKATIKSLGGNPVNKPNFDFTAGGAFPDVFSDYATYLAVAQTFEDTGVRAYKGQAANLISDNVILSAALRIHSVEARHASHLRTMRRNFYADNTIKPWITGNSSGGIGAAVQASYNGEDLTNQARIEIVNINGQSISFNAASECFDEPLSMDEVLAIVDPFIV